MRYLQIANFVLLALGLTFVVTLGVVALLLGVYVDEYPRYRGTLQGVFVIASLSAVLAAAGGLCARSLQRRWPLWPAWQVAGWGTTAVVALVAIRFLGS